MSYLNASTSAQLRLQTCAFRSYFLLDCDVSILHCHDAKLFCRNDFDWYYIATDGTYSQPDRIKYLVDHISINRRLYMGKPVSFSDKGGKVTYCDVS